MAAAKTKGILSRLRPGGGDAGPVPIAPDPDEEKQREELGSILRAVSWILGSAGLLIVLLAVGNLVSNGVASLTTVLRFTGGAALLCAAAGMLGILVGFLFGIPRTPIGIEGQPGGVNTNLEQISDWLTKILVGVGLTQLESLPTRLWAIAGKLADALPQSDGRQAIVLALLSYGAAAGFLTGYLLTRLFLAPALRRADRKAALLALPTLRTTRDLDATGRIDKLVEKLKELRASDENKLLGLSKEPPTSQPSVDAVIAGQDPDGLRFKDADIALQTLVRRLMLLPRSDEMLKPWEEALGTA